MQLRLSHYGHRLIEQCLALGADEAVLGSPLLNRLASFRDAIVLPATGDLLDIELLGRGWIEEVDDEVRLEEVSLRYRRNPLENVTRLVFEITTACNFRCLHCRNGQESATTETRLDDLADSAELMYFLGLRRFDYIGGEVTRHGRGWLDLVRFIRHLGEVRQGVVTNGWFLGRRDFTIEGCGRFKDDLAFLTELRDAGITHLIFSVDGPEAIHDRWRQTPGLYKRIVQGFSLVRDAGLEPRVSLVFTPGMDELVVSDWLSEIALSLYRGERHDVAELMSRLCDDDMNYMSNFIDFGRGARLSQGLCHLDEIPDELLRCKNVFRPSPSIRLQADGEVALCPLPGCAEGYGNVHERSFVEILNGLQEAFVARLHAERRIADARGLLDRNLFGDRFDHVCTVRAILSGIARELDRLGASCDDRQAVRLANARVAERIGVLDSGEK